MASGGLGLGGSAMCKGILLEYSIPVRGRERILTDKIRTKNVLVRPLTEQESLGV